MLHQKQERQSRESIRVLFSCSGISMGRSRSVHHRGSILCIKGRLNSSPFRPSCSRHYRSIRYGHHSRLRYLVLTFYTDLAVAMACFDERRDHTATAGVVPDTSQAVGFQGRHLLSQEDAQLLAMQVQKFICGGKVIRRERRGETVEAFHQKPGEFKWEELLQHVDLST